MNPDRAAFDGDWDGSPDDGRAALEQFAPRAGAALDAVEAGTWRAMADAGRLDLIDLAARVVAGQQGLPALERPSAHGASPWTSEGAAAWRRLDRLTDDERTALRFAEQMGFDVASLQPGERSALFGALGADAVPFAQAVYAADFLPRLRAGLDALFGASAWGVASDRDAELQRAIDELIRVVPQLQELDPITSELVRLLGARRHQCRICQSLRSRSALAAGADDEMFDAVNRYPISDLSDLGERQCAALAFCDALVSTPGSISSEVATALRAHFGPAECVELVLDVTRNATNKIAVALAADAPNVETGYEIYDVGPDGELQYGLEAP